jgi:hypothetical protein
MDIAKRGDVDISLLPWAWHELQNRAVRSTSVRGKFGEFVSDSAKSVNFIICLRSMFPSKVLARRLHLEYLAVSGECAEIQTRQKYDRDLWEPPEKGQAAPEAS